MSVHHYCFPSIRDNSVSVHHYCFPSIRDNSVSVRHYCFPCIKSVSWIHERDNSVSGQFGDNSVSVHHYCFPCIKSVSWIHERDNSVSVHERQFGVSSSLLLPLHQVGKLDSWKTSKTDREILSGKFGVSLLLGNSVSSIIASLAIKSVGTIRCHRDNSVSGCVGTIRCQFIIIASLASSR